jgi:hypothetical protein
MWIIRQTRPISLHFAPTVHTHPEMRLQHSGVCIRWWPTLADIAAEYCPCSVEVDRRDLRIVHNEKAQVLTEENDSVVSACIGGPRQRRDMASIYYLLLRSSGATE